MTGTKKPRRTGPGRLSAADAALLLDRVLDAAMTLFLEDGYAATTMENIAKRAGASTKTLYSRYTNKSEVLTAVAQRIVSRSLSETPILPGSEGDDPRAFVQTIAREFSSLYARPEPPRMMRLAMSEAHRHPELARIFIDVHVRTVNRIAEALERWRHAGKLPKLGDARATAMILIEMVASVPRIRAVLGQPLTRKETELYATTGAELFLRGLGYKDG